VFLSLFHFFSTVRESYDTMIGIIERVICMKQNSNHTFFFWIQGFYLNKTKLESILERPDYCLMSLQVFMGKFVFGVFCVLNGG
jgi:hypothetical protein